MHDRYINSTPGVQGAQTRRMPRASLAADARPDPGQHPHAAREGLRGEERFYGIEATMRDNSGNWFSMTQPSEEYASRQG
ncbi:MAG: hypothetical protein ACRDL1_03555 [Solirubrobacterales bacterium]